ncbi:MAG: carbohydrate ABC transporter permease [Clostridia bacterium]|nr:carbohydrate ABC transporter permease [Clostridia bacterium]
MSRSKASAMVSALLMALCVIPFLYIFVQTFFDQGHFTLHGYYQVFLAQTQYLARFWRSLGLCLVIALGQLLVSLLAGYGFAKCTFPGKNTIFFLLMLLMVMPLQVTLVPNYLMLDELHLIGTNHAIIWPMVFVPLGTFIMTQAYRSVSNSIVEAALLDGCGTLGVILRIAAPMNKSGLVCTALLSFLDGWNMVEQPIIFLKNFDQYPLSVGLASTPPGEPILQLVCFVLVVLPPMFLFSYFKTELVEGIAIGGEK